MSYSLALLCALSAAAAERLHGAKLQREQTWTTSTDEFNGPCAAHVREPLPVSVPLLCTEEAEGLQITAKAVGWGSPRLFIDIDGESFGFKQFPIHRAGQVWQFETASLSAGLHVIKCRGERLEMKQLIVEGTGGNCSFVEAPGYAEFTSSYTYRGLDVFHRLFGPDQDFPASTKQQLHFASESVGRNADGSIAATAVAEGFTKWMFMYSQAQDANDPWLGEKDGMSDEADITPYKQVSLEGLADPIDVCEPCNALSNRAVQEASVWMSCKGYSFDRDEYASLMAAFNALAAAGTFHHTCACKAGAHADAFAMDWLALQTHQVLLKQVLNVAGDSLSDGEKGTLLNLNKAAGPMTEVAKSLTTLFQTEYDHAVWDAALSSIDLPTFDMSIAGSIFLVTAALESHESMTDLGTHLESVVDALIANIAAEGAQWFTENFKPAARKAVSFVKLCNDEQDAVMDIVEHMLKFVRSFVHTEVFQDRKLEIPQAISDTEGQINELDLPMSIDSDMKRAWDWYNGYRCKGRSADVSFKEQASHGLLRIMSVAELLVNRVKSNEEEC